MKTLGAFLWVNTHYWLQFYSNHQFYTAPKPRATLAATCAQYNMTEKLWGMAICNGAPRQIEYKHTGAALCERKVGRMCCRRGQESDRLLISVPMSYPTTCAKPAMGSHAACMGASGTIAAGQHRETFL